MKFSACVWPKKTPKRADHVPHLLVNLFFGQRLNNELIFATRPETLWLCCCTCGACHVALWSASCHMVAVRCPCSPV